MKKRRHLGFSLIELMIVVAIVAILARIAYPAYLDSVRKGKRAQGRTALTELMQQQERYMSQRNCYLGFTTASASSSTPSSPGTACGGTTPTFTQFPFKTFSGDNPSSAAYLLEADLCPSPVSGGTAPTIAECVRVKARSQFTDPDIDVLWMTSTGVKGCDKNSAAVSNTRLCWP